MDRTLGENLELINEYLMKSGHTEELLTIGKLKGVGEDFDL